MVFREQEKWVSADEFWDFLQNLPDGDDGHYELIEGVIVPTTAPHGEEHGVLTSDLMFHLGIHVETSILGRITAETGYVLWKNPDPNGKDIILAPDVGFISKARMSATPARGFVDGAPDLAIEVLSPSDRMTKVMQKVQFYLQYGTRLIWVVDADEKKIIQFAPGGEIRLFGVADTLDGRDVLPGFALPLSELFPAVKNE